jgi:flagellar motor switch protein FliN/FliY
MIETLFLKTLENAALEMSEIPLFGSPPPFPFEGFAKALIDALEVKNVKIIPEKTEWLGVENLLDGMGKSPLIQPLTLTPLPGTVFWVMPQNAREKLIELLLRQTGKGLSDSTLQEGFLSYVLLNVLETFNTLNPYGNLITSFSEETPIPEEGALAIDLAIELNGTSLWGRLLISQETRASFKSYFTMEKPALLSDPKFSNLPLSLQLQVGSTVLSSIQWSKVSVGDFILLDRCTYNVQGGRGSAVLALGDTPLFDVRIKDGEIKILEYALIHEDRSMTEEEENLPPPNTEREEGDEEKPLWSAQNGDNEKITLPRKVPIQLTVEVGRLQMPLEKVTQLKAGNVLELGIGPKPDVYLTIGGKRVAKGELVNLGESLGVKILKLGD